MSWPIPSLVIAISLLLAGPTACRGPNVARQYGETPGKHSERPGGHSTTIGRHGTSGTVGGGIDAQSGSTVVDDESHDEWLE